MRRLACIAFIVAALVAPAFAVEFSQAQINGKRATVCRVNLKKERMQLFLRDEKGQPLKSFEGVLRFLAPTGNKLVFATNAGMYHPDLSPVGLFVEAGREISPLNLAPGEGNFFLKPNGVFVVTESGARVIESSEYPKLPEKAVLATQSGPLLVRANKIHAAFKPGSEFQLIRNGVGIPSPDVALFVQTDDVVNLHEMALLFRDVLHCPDALYFDGTVSSLHAPALGRSEKRIDLGPILGVVESNKPH
ncbi:phosphodiester glycosidase family protein [Verrucomicrobiota bacterium sgz303538]